MGLPTRPDVVVRAPKNLIVGERVVFSADLIAEKPTKVEFIDITIVGKQGWKIGAGEYQVIERVEFPKLSARVMNAGVLAPGTTTFSTSATLPLGMPPTHDVDPGWARLHVGVHVSIPWWPDARHTFDVPVRLPPPGAPIEPHPVVTRAPFNAAGDEPRIELALASSVLAAGDTLVGSCAVFHMDDDKPREVDISFEPYLVLLRGKPFRQQWGNGYRSSVTIPAGGAGQSVPFRIQLPAHIVPGFKTVSHELTWYLKARVGSFLRGKVELVMPLEIVDARAVVAVERAPIVPRVGDDRVIAAFQRFAAAQGWRSIADAEEGAEHPTTALQRGDDDVRIGYAYRGKAGTFLVGRIAYPRLGLGLVVSPTSRVRGLIDRDVEIGRDGASDLAVWDRRHHVDARIPAQTIPFLQAVVPSLHPEPALGELMRWTDDELVFERPIESIDFSELPAMAGALVEVDEALARARLAIEPPTAIDRTAWDELAGSLNGRLVVGDLSLTGRIGTARVELGLVWDPDNRPVAMRVSVGDPMTASIAAREASLSLARPSIDATGVPIEKVAARLATWPADVVDLKLADGVASASLSSEIADAKRIRGLVRSLHELLAGYDENVGPYR